MSNKIMPKNETSDLNQLRSLLFGEQAQQTDERFETLDNAVNSLRRENRQLRHALEVEAMTRIEADESMGSSFSTEVDTSLSELSEIMLAFLSDTREKRGKQHAAMLETLTSMEQGQDAVTSQLIEHLQAERKARAKQFELLKGQLSAETDAQNAVGDAIAARLTAYAAKHESGAVETTNSAELNGSSNESAE